MKVAHTGNEITINGHKVTFPQEIEEVVVLEDRVILRLLTDDFEEGDPLEGQNILALDAEGKLLWRIEGPIYTNLNEQDEKVPGGYSGLAKSDDGQIFAFIPIGYVLDLDSNTGKVSNPVFVK